MVEGRRLKANAIESMSRLYEGRVEISELL